MSEELKNQPAVDTGAAEEVSEQVAVRMDKMHKLEEKGIKYTENNSVDEMLSLGISQVPVLSVNNKLLDFSTANDWVNQQ